MADTENIFKKWIEATSAATLIKEAMQQKGFKLALKAVEAASPVIQKFGCGMITGVGNVPCFLQVSIDLANNVEASLVIADIETGDPIHHLSSNGEEAKKLAAAFAMDYEDANFLYLNDDNEPKRLMLLTPSSIKYENMDTHIMCLSNLRLLVLKGNYSFHVGCSK